LLTPSAIRLLPREDGMTKDAADGMTKDAADQGAWVIERRRHARMPGDWAVRWIVGEYMVVLETRALDASLHGLRLEVPLKDLSNLLTPGQRHRVEILVGGNGKRVTRMAEVRHVSETSVGFFIDEALPMDELRRHPMDPDRAALSHVRHDESRHPTAPDRQSARTLPS
jgi:hypothetical protein